MKKPLITTLALLCMLALASCGLFTTTLSPWAVRDMTSTLQNNSASDISNMATTQLISQSQAKDIVAVLSSKTTEELLNLTSSEKTVVMDTTLTALIPNADSLLNGIDQTTIDSLLSGNGTTSDAVSVLTTVYNNAVNNVDSSVDTGAILTLLTDNDSVTQLAQDDPISLATTVIAVVASIADRENQTIDQATIEAIVNNVSNIGTDNITQESVTEEIKNTIGATDQESNAIVNALDAVTSAITATTETPVISYPTGDYEPGDSVTLTITCPTENATIYYTTDGTTPTTATAAVYTAPFTVELNGDGATIQAFAVSDDMKNSAVARTLIWVIPEIYLDGQNGDDNNSGTSEQTPVKTFAKAKELTQGQNTVIYVLSYIDITTPEVWDGENRITVLAHQNFSESPTITGFVFGNNFLEIRPLVAVAEGASLCLANIILDGNNLATNGIYNDGSLCIQNGTTIQYNTTIDDIATDSFGGGVLNHGDFTMEGGTISNNTATACGGGVYNNGTFTMTAGTISYNTAQGTYISYGGGVWNRGIFTIKGGTISYNTTTTTQVSIGGGGGGVYNNGGTFIMTAGTISYNTAVYNGGGVYGGGSLASITMEGGSIEHNTAVYNGGGVYFSDGSNTMTAGIIHNNSAPSGGGVFVDRDFTIQGGSIEHNSATNGGGVYINRDFFVATVTMEDGTISNNTVSRYGGGVYNLGFFTMNGGSIEYNSATIWGGGIINQYSFIMTAGIIQGNTASEGGATIYSRTDATLSLPNISIDESEFDDVGYGYNDDIGVE